MTRFRVTYEIVTPESAEHGAFEETGFVTPGEWKDDIETALCYSAEDYRMTLREALALCSPDCDCGRWLCESAVREDYATGAVETRSLHPPDNISPSSYRRIRRLLGIRHAF